LWLIPHIKTPSVKKPVNIYEINTVSEVYNVFILVVWFVAWFRANTVKIRWLPSSFTGEGRPMVSLQALLQAKAIINVS
jgi:hypothetical protein